MKHHDCHCGFSQHFHLRKLKKLGVLGGVLLTLHLLLHIAECIFLPALFVGLTGHIHHSSSHESSGPRPAITIVATCEVPTLLSQRLTLETADTLPQFRVFQGCLAASLDIAQ